MSQFFVFLVVIILLIFSGFFLAFFWKKWFFILFKYFCNENNLLKTEAGVRSILTERCNSSVNGQKFCLKLNICGYVLYILLIDFNFLNVFSYKMFEILQKMSNTEQDLVEKFLIFTLSALMTTSSLHHWHMLVLIKSMQSNSQLAKWFFFLNNWQNNCMIFRVQLHLPNRLMQLWIKHMNFLSTFLKYVQSFDK